MGKCLLVVIFLFAMFATAFGVGAAEEIFADDFEWGYICAWSNATQDCPCPANGFVPCTGADTCCPNICADLQTDRLNCGTCENVCGGNSDCEAGICIFTCEPECTDGIMPGCCSAGCTDMFIDGGNCGACDVVCPSGLCLAGGCL